MVKDQKIEVTKLFNCANCKGEKTVRMVIQRKRVSTSLELFECTQCDHQWDYTDFYGQNADPKKIYYRELKKIQNIT